LFVPEVGQCVAFNLAQGHKGIAAVDVELIESPPPQKIESNIGGAK
jgi:hypothetical protein